MVESVHASILELTKCTHVYGIQQRRQRIALELNLERFSSNSYSGLLTYQDSMSHPGLQNLKHLK